MVSPQLQTTRSWFALVHLRMSLACPKWVWFRLRFSGRRGGVRGLVNFVGCCRKRKGACAIHKGEAPLMLSCRRTGDPVLAAYRCLRWWRLQGCGQLGLLANTTEQYHRRVSLASITVEYC
jgi:hypothetical protein